MRKIIYILAVLIVSAVFSVSALAAIPVEVTVGKGTVVTLKKKAKRIVIADPAVADLILFSPSELLLNGKKAGTTSLIIWDEDGTSTFFDVLVAQGKTPLVEAPQVMLEVKVAQIDRTKLKELGIGFLVKGSTAEGFGSPNLTPGGTLGDNPGTDIAPGITGFALDTLAPQIGVAHYPSGVAAVIRALSEKGLAKVLAEPNLVVRSGEKGSFLAGSKVPVQQVIGVGTAQTISVVYEEVGVKLNFAPEVLENGTIRLKIDPAEVSNIARFLTFAGIIAPQIDTREVRTSVDLKEGESLVLAGLLNDEMKKNIQKIPLLGDIPILGAIFRSTREELEKTELAFFITPRLVKPMAPGTERPELPNERVKPKEQKDYDWVPIPSGGDSKEEGK